MKVIGILLIALSLLGFVFGGVMFKTHKTLADVGPLHLQTEEEHALPVTPLASGAALVAGIALLWIGTRRRS